MKSKSKVYFKETVQQKIWRRIKKRMRAIKEYRANNREFGRKTANLLLKRSWGFVPAEEYISAMSDYMASELKPVIAQYKKGNYLPCVRNTPLGKYPFWVCWLQGEEKMPLICKCCLENIRKTCPKDAELIFLTYDNYLSYIDIPEDIVKKHKEGIISAVNYTDIIRYGLLATYGGMWADAGIYFTGDALKKGISLDFLTPAFLNEKVEDASRGKWVGGCWFSRPGRSNILFNFAYDSLIYYWRKHDRAVEYLAADYVLWAAYTELAEAKKIIDDNPLNNQEFRLLNNSLYEAYSEDLFNRIVCNNDIHIINRHPNYPVKDVDGNKTIYGYLLELMST